MLPPLASFSSNISSEEFSAAEKIVAYLSWVGADLSQKYLEESTLEVALEMGNLPIAHLVLMCREDGISEREWKFFVERITTLGAAGLSEVVESLESIATDADTRMAIREMTKGLRKELGELGELGRQSRAQNPRIKIPPSVQKKKLTN